MIGHWQKRILLFVAEQGGATRPEIENHFAGHPHYRKWSKTGDSVWGLIDADLLREAGEDSHLLRSHRTLLVTDEGREVIARMVGEA